MEKLKLKNRHLEEENAMLKAKMIEMGQFSKRMVEITAEMDYLLNQRTKEIEQLKQEINSSNANDPDSQIVFERVWHPRPYLLKTPLPLDQV